MSEVPAIDAAPAPEVTNEHAYVMALTAALVETLGPKKGRLLLQTMAATFAASVERSDVVPIRGDRQRIAREQDAKINAARRFRADLSTLIRALP